MIGGASLAKILTATTERSPIHRGRRGAAWLSENRHACGLKIHGAWIRRPAEAAFRLKPIGSVLHTIANDLNPVAWLILKATVEFPLKYGTGLLRAIPATWRRVSADERVRTASSILSRLEPLPNSGPDGLPLVPHHHLPLLRRAGAAVAQLAAGQQGDGRAARPACRRPERIGIARSRSSIRPRTKAPAP